MNPFPKENKVSQAYLRPTDWHLKLLYQIEYSCIHPQLRTQSDHDWNDVEVWDVRAFSIKLRIPLKMFSPIKMGIGRLVEMKFNTSKNNFWDIPCTISHVEVYHDFALVELNRLDLGIQKLNKQGNLKRLKRQQGRFYFKKGFRLKGHISHPIHYAELSEVCILNLNPKMGLALECYDDNLFLAQGMRIQLRLDLPTFFNTSYQGEVAWVSSIPGKTGLRFGLKCLHIPRDLAQSIIDFYMGTQTWTPESLRRYGFPVESIRNTIEFRFAQEESEKQQARQLQTRSTLIPEQMVQRPEAESEEKILCAYHHHLLVASITLCFPQAEFDKDWIEASIIGMDPRYGGSDLLPTFIEQILRHAILSGRKKIKTHVPDALEPVYSALGFKPWKERIWYLSVHTVLTGRKMGLISWNYFYGDLIHELLDSKYVSFSFLEKMEARLRLLIKNLTNKIIQKRLEIPHQKKLEAYRLLIKESHKLRNTFKKTGGV